MYRDYRDDVQFFYVYKSVEHPGVNGYIAPFTIEERLKHIEIAKERTQSEIPWICDTMENDVKLAIGGAPNGELVIDPEGNVLRKRFWSDPDRLRADLEELIGEVASPTKIEDLPTKFLPERREIASGVAPIIDLPRGLVPLIMRPIPGDDEVPFYAKLRVEATKGIRSGRGKLHCAVYLDPIYKVHWNNRAGKVQLSFEGNKQIKFDYDGIVSDRIEEDADIDPRHFLVDITTDRRSKDATFRVKVSYTVCDDDETFCLDVEQEYEVTMLIDHNGGTRPGIFLNTMFEGILDFDENNDGIITRDEVPESKFEMYRGHLDYNFDEEIDESEIERFMKMFNNGAGMNRPDGISASDKSEQDSSDERNDKPKRKKKDSPDDNDETP